MYMEAILAVDLQGGIAKDGKIPWMNKTDMQFFYKKTVGNTVIMGKNTYLSLPEKYRPLPKRLNIVLSKSLSPVVSDSLIIIKDISLLSNILKEFKQGSTVFVIGGKQIYEELVPQCHTVWLTTIKDTYNCDVIFNYDYASNFKERTVHFEDTYIKIEKLL